MRLNLVKVDGVRDGHRHEGQRGRHADTGKLWSARVLTVSVSTRIVTG
jgi:hypothetical protein